MAAVTAGKVVEVLEAPGQAARDPRVGIAFVLLALFLLYLWDTGRLQNVVSAASGKPGHLPPNIPANAQPPAAASGAPGTGVLPPSRTLPTPPLLPEYHSGQDYYGPGSQQPEQPGLMGQQTPIYGPSAFWSIGGWNLV